jgi:hypothetical protein
MPCGGRPGMAGWPRPTVDVGPESPAVAERRIAAARAEMPPFATPEARRPMADPAAHPYGLGWHPDFADRARRTIAAQGIRLYRVAAAAKVDIPPAWSLSAFRLRHLEQGQAGTCWVHAPTQLAETFAGAHGYPAFPICRRLVAWKGSQLEGGGNPSNGGDPTDAILAMTEGKGVGIGHEALCPYSDDYRVLGSRPPAPVFDDAKSVHIAAPIEVSSDDDARALIYNGSAVANGIWWPWAWDTNDAMLIDYIGRGTYGHALAEIGYVTKGVWPGTPGQYDWFQLDNWHGLLYKPLTPELAEKVPNYKPIQADKTSDFWVRADIYAKVRGYGNAIRCSATDMDGLTKIADLGDALADFG